MSAADRAKSSRRAQGLDEHVSDRTVLGLVADLVLKSKDPAEAGSRLEVGCHTDTTHGILTTAGHHSGHRHPRGGGRGG